MERYFCRRVVLIVVALCFIGHGFMAFGFAANGFMANGSVANGFTSRAADFRFYDYGKLSCSLVKNLCQDGQGFVWVGTEYGLNRFDGHKFAQYFHSDSDTTSLLSNDVRCLYLDRGNRLWVGTSRGLQVYDAAADRFGNVPFEGLGGTAVNQILQRGDGRIIVVTTGHGLYQLDERSDRLAGLELGADAYLAKPFVLNELTALIINLINGRQLLRGKFSGSQEQAERVETVEVKGNDEWLMERVMKAVNAHLSDAEFTVEALASEVGLSRVQLHRRMKEMTSIATSDFIRNLRIKQAARLLAERKTNVSQVAYAVGFVNRTHFSTVFKKYYGLSPQEYAEKNAGLQDGERQ